VAEDEFAVFTAAALAGGALTARRSCEVVAELSKASAIDDGAISVFAAVQELVAAPGSVFLTGAGDATSVQSIVDADGVEATWRVAALVLVKPASVIEEGAGLENVVFAARGGVEAAGFSEAEAGQDFGALFDFVDAGDAFVELSAAERVEQWVVHQEGEGVVVELSGSAGREDDEVANEGGGGWRRELSLGASVDAEYAEQGVERGSGC
jgi:hypothetical protein